jgi:hypothetical protein
MISGNSLNEIRVRRISMIESVSSNNLQKVDSSLILIYKFSLITLHHAFIYYALCTFESNDEIK